MLYFTIPTISQVRKEAIKAADEAVEVNVKVVSIDAPEGWDETATFYVRALPEAEMGRDCDGSMIVRPILSIRLLGTSGDWCSLYTDNQTWRDTVVGLYNQRVGYHRGKADGKREECAFWVQVLAPAKSFKEASK